MVHGSLGHRLSSAAGFEVITIFLTLREDLAMRAGEHSRPDRQSRRECHPTEELTMKKLTGILFSTCILLAAGSSFAQDAMKGDAMKGGAMAGDGMAGDAMAKDAMKKDHMKKKSAMKKDHMKKDHMAGDAMPNDAMAKDGMDKDAMKK
jgi:pentapeptide MXKDX repeat protein